MLEILDIEKDTVIDSPYITVKTSYEYALKKLYPLINQLEFQRNPLKKEYYENHPLVVNYLYLQNEVNEILQTINQQINNALK